MFNQQMFLPDAVKCVRESRKKSLLSERRCRVEKEKGSYHIHRGIQNGQCHGMRRGHQLFLKVGRRCQRRLAATAGLKTREISDSRASLAQSVLFLWELVNWSMIVLLCQSIMGLRIDGWHFSSRRYCGAPWLCDSVLLPGIYHRSGTRC